jgi:hypothetical protein
MRSMVEGALRQARVEGPLHHRTACSGPPPRSGEE